MELTETEYNTLIYAIETAIYHQNELVKKHNDTTFDRQDFKELLNKIKKQHRQKKKK